MQVPRVRAQGQGRVQGVTRERVHSQGFAALRMYMHYFSNRQMVL